MQRPLIGIAIPAVIIAGGFGLLQEGNSGSPASHGAPQMEDGRAQHCVEIPARTPVLELNLASQKVVVPSKGDPSVCVTWDSQVEGTPTVTYFKNCGSVCAAVRVEDIAISEDLELRVAFQDGDERRSIKLHPRPVSVTQAGQNQCLAIYDPDKPSPCDVLVTAPANLVASAGKGEVRLTWSASEEANGRDLEISYEVWRATTDGSDSFMNVATVGETAFVDSGLERNTTYWYYVVAVAETGHRSSGSETVSTTTN